MMNDDIDDMMLDAMVALKRYDIELDIDRKLFHKLIIDDVWVPKGDCIIGGVYICNGRNFVVGVWNGSSFDYIRYKFGDTFPDKEYHWDDGPPHGTVKPYFWVGDA